MLPQYDAAEDHLGMGSTDITVMVTQKSALQQQVDHLSMIELACFTSLSGGAHSRDEKHGQSRHTQTLKLPMTTEESLICLDSRSHSKHI
jgi:hypothetical protein